MNQLTGACIIGQSGGPTAVINASAQGVDVYKRQPFKISGLR